jgi:hypothetical protein
MLMDALPVSRSSTNVLHIAIYEVVFSVPDF